MYSFAIIILFQFVGAYYDEQEMSGGHSREYRTIDESGSAWNELIADWHAGLRIRRGVDLTIDEIKNHIQTFKPAFDSASGYILNIVKNRAALSGRLKSAYSIQEKLQRKGYGLESLTDIIGLRLTCQTVDEALKMKDMVKNSDKFDVTEETCYGMCPGAGKYKASGYRRIHLIINIKPENKFAELQIGTPYTNLWSDWSHDIIYKGPKELSDSKDVQAYSLSMADYFWKLDEDRKQLPICPEVMKNQNALNILKQSLPENDAVHTFAKIGKPPNACFWWNDMKVFIPSNIDTDEQDKSRR